MRNPGFTLHGEMYSNQSDTKPQKPLSMSHKLQEITAHISARSCASVLIFMIVEMLLVIGIHSAARSSVGKP